METKDSVEQETVQQAEAAAAEETTQEAAADTTEEAAETPEEKLQKQLDELNDRYMRMAAEYDNYRKRALKERDMVRSEATGKALTAILPIYDNLERALAQETADTEYKKGVEMTARQFEAALESLGVEIITAEPGSAFDPTVHNAVMHVEDEELGESCIAECFQKGFRHGDKVIRTAMVKVAN
ncbi:nucleotide exchange factor GrpE [Butyricicoccus sp.]|uniref:nucleotide exchange factor GrpE n=1 Tax=Butyricicoccus sp. TaxID=2049021 RepID=UPI003F16DAD0